MKKRVVLFFLVFSLILLNTTVPTTADVYKDEVSIHFQNETQDSTNKEKPTKNEDLIIGKPNDNNHSRLPQTGEMLTSIIVLLSGIIIVLLLVLIYLIRDIHKIKRIEGN